MADVTLRKALHQGVVHDESGGGPDGATEGVHWDLDTGDGIAGEAAATQVHVGGTREDDGPAMGGVFAGDAQDLIVPESGTRLESYGSTASPDRAAPFPVSGLEGSPRSILREYGADAIAMGFDTANGLRDLAERARAAGRDGSLSPKEALQTEMAAIGMASKVALRFVDYVVPKEVHVGVVIENSSQVPNWLKLPQTVRDEVNAEPKVLAAYRAADPEGLPSPKEDDDDG